MGLCAVFSSVSAFAEAGWVGAGVINVNGTWYRADVHPSTSWASGEFSGHDFGSIASLQLGGQVQLWDVDYADWGSGTKAKMYYKIDDGAFQALELTYYDFKDNNNFFQSGGSGFASSTIDISGLSLEEHTLYIYFDDIDSKKTTETYSATFTKAIDINDVDVTGINATYEWTGSAIKPTPTLTYSASTLTLSTDYTVSYSDGCTNAGVYSVTITGAGDYINSKVINYTINPGYYVAGIGGVWTINPDYRLSRFDADQYSINDLVMHYGDQIKVVSSNDGSTINSYYPGKEGQGNKDIDANKSYTIYFRPAGGGGDGWHYGSFYVTPTTSVTVPLAPTGYGTYYNSVCGVTLPAGAEAYIMADGAPTYTKIADGNNGSNNTVPADVAMLLKGTSSVALTLSTSITGSVGSNLLQGSDVSATTTGGSTYYKLTYGSEPGHEDIFGWYWGEDEGAAFTSPAHKAWLALPAGARAFVDLPGDETTGIKSMNNGQFDNGAVYDLQGRRVAQPTKGLYIVNGKKVIK